MAPIVFWLVYTGLSHPRHPSPPSTRPLLQIAPTRRILRARVAGIVRTSYNTVLLRPRETEIVCTLRSTVFLRPREAGIVQISYATLIQTEPKAGIATGD